MHLTLPPRYEELVREKVESGVYCDANEVVQEALRFLDERDRLAWLRAEAAAADEEVARGEVVEYTPEFMERLKREADEDERNGVPMPDDVLP
jgi:antitoxin ParD1/3/4